MPNLDMALCYLAAALIAAVSAGCGAGGAAVLLACFRRPCRCRARRGGGR